MSNLSMIIVRGWVILARETLNKQWKFKFVRLKVAKFQAPYMINKSQLGKF